MKVALVIGTRPEIIKMSPIVKVLARRDVEYFILHTGQHYSDCLDLIFFQQLDMPMYRYNLKVGSTSPSKQVAKMMTGIEEIFRKDTPDVVLVEGDTNTALAGALVASQHHIRLGHVEAGLRSYDNSMPEEMNRILIDHCSDILFAPTLKAVTILQSEGISHDKLWLTGNTVVDAVYQNIKMPYTTNIEGGIPDKYMLVTVHRQENVDNKVRFSSILDGLNSLIDQYGLPMIYPIHPHSVARMKKYGLQPGEITMISPVGYFEFLHLEQRASLILTDSGGVQEESCILRVPCVTLRDNTERPETVEVGSNILAGISPDKILDCAGLMLNKTNNWKNPFGDGNAAEKIVDLIL